MANTNLPVLDTTRAGINIGVNGALEVTAVAANHHTFANDGKTIILARNNGATPRTVTLTIQVSVDGVAVTVGGKTIALAATGSAGDHKAIGPFPSSVYAVASGADVGLIYIDADHADVRLQAIRMTAL